MLRSLKEVENYTVVATDGDIGKVVDFLLDDDRWTVRYLIVQPDGPLFMDGRRVLISPMSFREVAWSTQRFHLALTKDKVRNSPSVDVDKPVSRQHEREYNGYYGYPYYWGYEGIWGMGAYPGSFSAGRWNDAPVAQADTSGDVHLRSAKELRGYHIQGNDDAVGHVEDFIVDDETWGIRYLAINTSNWWVGKKVLVAPHWAKGVSWEERKVFVDLSRHVIKSSPEWDASAAINREYEARLYDYYGRPVYWEDGARSVDAPPVHRTKHPPA